MEKRTCIIKSSCAAVLLLMIQNYTFQLLLCQIKIIKILLNNKIKDFKDLFIRTNIKQKNKLRMRMLNLSKFVTRGYVRVNRLSNTYDENKSIRFKTPMLRSDLCDYADAYILVNGIITVTANAGANNIRDKKKIEN